MATALICILSSGCSDLITEALPESEDNPGSSIFVLASSSEMAASNTFDSNNAGPHVFSGNDILWFNETTRELRFKDNYSFKQVILKYDAISFFIHDEYLFSSMVYVSSKGVQLINSLVLYYNQIENKYFLLDGYPEQDVLEKNEPAFAPITDHEDIKDLPQYAKDIRSENALKIAAGWEKFINQMKNEGLLK